MNLNRTNKCCVYYFLFTAGLTLIISFVILHLLTRRFFKMFFIISNI